MTENNIQMLKNGNNVGFNIIDENLYDVIKMRNVSEERTEKLKRILEDDV